MRGCVDWCMVCVNGQGMRAAWTLLENLEAWVLQYGVRCDVRVDQDCKFGMCVCRILAVSR
jgi:hypothetical protein